MATTLTEDLFQSIKYISEATAADYDNVIIGEIIDDSNKESHKYDVLVNEVIYKNLYSVNTDLAIGDLIYLIRFRQGDKVIIGGLYYDNTQVFSEDLVETFVSGTDNLLGDNTTINRPVTLTYADGVNSMWSEENFSRLYLKTSIKTFNISEDNTSGKYGLNITFSSAENYSVTIEKALNSDKLFGNPFRCSGDFGKEIEMVLDISNIPSIFDNIQITPFQDGEGLQNGSITYTNSEIKLGYDKDDLAESKIVLGLISNNTSLEYNLLSDTSRTLLVTYISLDDEVSYITDLKQLDAAEVRWYQYLYGEPENDLYGGENWMLLDRAIDGLSLKAVKNDAGYYYLSANGYSNQSLLRQINLNTKVSSMLFKAVLVFSDTFYTSNILTFNNTKTDETTEIQNTSLSVELLEYIESTDTDGNIVLQECSYNGIYNIYPTINIPFVRIKVSPSNENLKSFKSVLWKIPLNNSMIDTSDLDTTLKRNNNILVTEKNITNEYLNYLYDYVQDRNYVYFYRNIMANEVINYESFEITFKATYENYIHNSIECYFIPRIADTNTLNTIYIRYSEIYEELEKTYGSTTADLEDIILQQEKITYNNKTINLLGFINKNNSSDRHIFYYYENDSVILNFAIGKSGSNGTDYTLSLSVVPNTYYEDGESRELLAPDVPYLVVLGQLTLNGIIKDLNDYDVDMSWVFPDQTYLLTFSELDNPSLFGITTTNNIIDWATADLNNRYWIVMPENTVSWKGLSSYDAIEEYYWQIIKKQGRNFRNKLIQLAYDNHKVFNQYKSEKDTFLDWNDVFIKVLNGEEVTVNDETIKLEYKDVIMDSESFENIWNGSGWFTRVLAVLQKIYHYTDMNSVKIEYIHYRLCRQYLTDWVSNEQYEKYGEYLEGPGIIITKSSDLQRDNSLDKNYQQEGSLSGLVASVLSYWQENYNILNLSISSLSINTILPIAVSVENITKDKYAQTFTGNCIIEYDSSGEIIDNNYKTYTRTFAGLSTIDYLICRSDNKWFDDNIKYNLEYKSFTAPIKSNYNIKIASQNGLIAFPKYYPTTSNKNGPKVCVILISMAGGGQPTTVSFKILSPIYLSLNKYDNDKLNNFETVTKLDASQQEITTQSLMIGEKTSTNTYNGWNVEEDSAILYKDGQIYGKIATDGKFTIGPSGEDRIVLNGPLGRIETQYGNIDLKKLVELTK